MICSKKYGSKAAGTDCWYCDGVGHVVRCKPSVGYAYTCPKYSFPYDNNKNNHTNKNNNER